MRATVAAVAVAILALLGPAVAVAQPADVDVYVAEAILAVEDKQWDTALDLLRAHG